jgi:hypothetical protein
MGIRYVASIGNSGAPVVGWSPVGNSLSCLPGDVHGLTTGGFLNRLDDEGGQVITAGGGIWGIGINTWTSDASGNLTNPAVPTGVNPNVPAQLALSSYNRRTYANEPIAGVYRGLAEYWKPDFNNVFIQRMKQGIRVNSSLVGKKCDLVYNDTTNEWEPDTSATSVNDIVISEIQFPLYKDNISLWDSATFATDTYGAWVAFQIVRAFDAEANGLRY